MNILSVISRTLHSNMAGHQRLATDDWARGGARFFDRRLRSGWYMVELQVDEGGGRVSILPAYPPSGSIMFRQFLLPVADGRLVKRIVYLSGMVSGVNLRHDADYFAGDIKVLRFVRLRTGFARKRMLRRLLGSMDGNAAQYRQTISKNASLAGVPDDLYLFRLYDRTFMLSDETGYSLWLESQPLGALSAPVLVDGDMVAGDGWIHGEEFSCFIMPGYKVTTWGLQLLRDALRSNAGAFLAYPDEDCLDERGQRSWPAFKPDWSPDSFLSYDYISACFVCRRSWFEQYSAVFDRLGVAGALTYLLPSQQAAQIMHLPQVACHRTQAVVVPVPQYRMDALETILSGSGKQDLFAVGAGLLEGSLRLQYAVPTPPPLVSLLIPTRDGLHVLRPCVESILEKTDYAHYEILILDNQSREPETLAWLTGIQNDPRVRVLLYDQPFNYSAINNFGARHAKGSVIGLINNDVEVISPGWLTEMVSQACRPEIGCVGAKLYYGNGQIQHGGVILGLGDVAGHAHRFLERDADGYQGRLKLVQNYSAVTAACLVVRREVYEQVGGLEEKHLTVAYNDVDFCLRVRAAGYRNLWTPYAELYHHESISRGEDDTPEKKARYDKEVAYMWRTWRKELEHDPCYNPNLSRRREDFSLREFLP